MGVERAKWLQERKWGVCMHYLADYAGSFKDTPITTAEGWNHRVNNFDTEGLAKQLKSIGAGYLIITLGQNSGFYCSPNAMYDSIVGNTPSKCSNRDLIADIYSALEPMDIKLMLYFTCGAPDKDEKAVRMLGGYNDFWTKTPQRLEEFQQKWELVIREWSLRYGKRVCGWWVDGCYFADAMYRHPEPPNFESLAGAFRAGNPDAILAFNPGVRIPVISVTEYEDFTAGELDRVLPVCHGWDEELKIHKPLQSQVNGAQFHVLDYIGEFWGRGEPRFPEQLIAGYTYLINQHGGVVSWDVPATYEGLISDKFLQQLYAIGRLLLKG